MNRNYSFLKKIIEKNNNIKFKSQFDQDLLAYSYFNGKRNDFFVDIGAHNGEWINNTYIFEQLGWNGICVEADPDNFELLKKNRKCYTYNFAIDSENSDNIKFIKSKVDALNVLEKHCSEEHAKRIKSEAKIDNLEYVNIKSITFNDLMKKYHSEIKHIDFLSIDIEGGELDILKTIDFYTYTFDLLTIENNEKENVLIDFMKTKGYKVLIDIGCDILFVKE
ncbi:FkbM family methyltransferase [Brachyspira alvinipulli]|uniref:FkbM family methyltransferase n=1 Tax=Brachyspira alvinipulli TaxID=84379 RepID=UPI0004B587AC|nr:FkbM family methyltransferase [Brachyspira alvinipulli]